jgi:hypothetical protein
MSSKIVGRDELAHMLGFDQLPPSVRSPRVHPEPSPTPVEDVAKATSNRPAEQRKEPVSALATIQQQYALVELDGRHYTIERERVNARTDDGLAVKLALLNQRDGELKIRRAVRKHFPQADAKAIANEFFYSPDTVCFQGIEFNPRTTTPGYLNLWIKPVIQLKEGNSDLINQFLFEIICNSDRDVYEYLIHYLAHALQRPWEKPGVMITLLGGQGTGKGTFGQILRGIWGPSFLQIHKMDSITGSFNGSLERAFIVFVDEALFVGNRSGTDALKSLVTEPIIEVNEKYQPQRQIASYHRFFLATNATHLKHTDRDDRRDLSLRLSEARKGDHAYWQNIHRDMATGGIEAFAAELMEMDISAFNVRDKPSTPELLEQKLFSLDGIAQWWFDSLQDGQMTDHGAWSNWVSTQDALDAINRTPAYRSFRAPRAQELVLKVTHMCPSARKGQKRNGNERTRGLTLPALEQARSEFEDWIGSKIDW